MNTLHNVVHRLRRLILIEIAGHRNFIARLGLALVDPRIRGVGQNFPGKIGVNVLHQRHIFGVPQGGVRHRLAPLHHDLAVFVPLRTLHYDFVVAELLTAENLALTVHTGLVPIRGVVPVFAVGLHDQLPAMVADVVALGADGFAALLVAVGRVNELHLAAAVGRLVLAQHPDIGGNAGVHKLVGGKLDNGVQPIVFQNILADVAGAAPGIAGKQR